MTIETAKTEYGKVQASLDDLNKQSRDSYKAAEAEPDYDKKHSLFKQSREAKFQVELAKYDAMTYRQLEHAKDKDEYLRLRDQSAAWAINRHEKLERLTDELVAENVQSSKSWHRGEVSAESVGQSGGYGDNEFKSVVEAFPGISSKQYETAKELHRNFQMGFEDSAAKVAYYGEPRELTRGNTDAAYVSHLLPEKVGRGGAEDDVKAFMNKAVMAVQMKDIGLNGIISSGRMKNIFEGGKGGIGAGRREYKQSRMEGEEKRFGISEDAPPQSRPIYGYLEHPDRLESSSGDLTTHYGGNQVVLKNDLKQRMSYTVGDSLDDQGAFGRRVGAVNDPVSHIGISDHHWMDKDKTVNIKAGASKNDWNVKLPDGREVAPQYIEAQVHGGVAINDIAEIRLAHDKTLTPTQEKKLAKAGVKVSRNRPPFQTKFYGDIKPWDQAYQEE